MGLDSVELIVEVEKFFNITIPDNEAEQVFTVEDFAKTVSNHLIFQTTESEIFKTVFNKIQNYFIHELPYEIDSFQLEVPLENLFIYDDKQGIWDKMQEYIELEIPKLSNTDLIENYHPKSVRFFGITIDTSFKKQPILKDKTVKNLVDWIISINYQSLINPQKISNLYEIERAIVGITSEKCGIDVQDIELYHRFTYDLGIN
jgi:hypothetical protein